jgi:hypothetical protein
MTQPEKTDVRPRVAALLLELVQQGRLGLVDYERVLATLWSVDR